MPPKVLILPGYTNSGPLHWQTLWEAANPSYERIRQHSWDHPVCDEWVTALHSTVTRSRTPVVLIAHSLACLMVAHWVARGGGRGVLAALLVAPPDPELAGFPSEIQGFAPTPSSAFPFPCLVVSSEDDPYCDSGYGERCAAAWGARHLSIGKAGHINSASNLGSWPQGRALLDALLENRPLSLDPTAQANAAAAPLP